jgi:hypothetical protein
VGIASKKGMSYTNILSLWYYRVILLSPYIF